MSTISAKRGHVKRRLCRNEPLKGTLLEFALGFIVPNADGDFGEIRRKLVAGEPLDEYEYHLFVEIILDLP